MGAKAWLALPLLGLASGGRSPAPETLKTLDDPQVESVFLFRRGERVVGSRGAGRITEGYASGSVIQYVIEGTDGNRFMADQQDLDRQ